MFKTKKNNQQKQKAKIIVETMEDDMANSGGKVKEVEVDNLTTGIGGDMIGGVKQNNDNQQTKLFNHSEQKSDLNEKKVDDVSQTALHIVDASSLDNKKSDVLSSSFVKQPVQRDNSLSSEIQNIHKTRTSDKEFSQKFSFGEKKHDLREGDNQPFLHESIKEEKKNDNISISDSQLKSNSLKTEQKVNNNQGKRFIIIIIFILLLTGLLTGGYFLYMNKSKLFSVKKIDIRKKDEGNSDGLASQTTSETVSSDDTTMMSDKDSQENDDSQRKKIMPNKIVIEGGNFEIDLKNFVNNIKRQGGDSLKSGILVAPIDLSGNNFLSSKMISVLEISDVVDQATIKDVCSLFFLEDDDGIVRVAVVFELKDGVEVNQIASSIVKKENILPVKLLKLFVDGNKPMVPKKIVFKDSFVNPGSRYMNYEPENSNASIDWGPINLKEGTLLYFATSKKEAQVLMEYFRNMVNK